MAYPTTSTASMRVLDGSVVAAREPSGVRGAGRVPSCPVARCVPSGQRDHHDRLLATETDGDELLELFELAVTWDELDYSRHGLVPPEEWPGFGERHDWADPERMTRIFSLAADIAARCGCRCVRGQVPDLAARSGR